MCAVSTANQASARQKSENDAPVFREGAAATRSLAENTEGDRDVQLPVSATDADGHRLTYSLGGEDVDSFAIDPRDGQVRTRAGVDFDHEAKDRYAITVRAEDGRGGSAEIAVVIEVTDQPEAPSAPAKPTIAESTRNTLTVSWTASANTGPLIREYEGQYRVAGAGAFEPGWNRIGAVEEATIGGLAEDTLHEVRVRARNAEGTGDWSESVEGRTALNQAPMFDEGSSAQRHLVENTQAGVSVGAPIAARDADGDQLVYRLEQPEQPAFSIDSSNGLLRTRAGASYDYEAQKAHTLTVRVEDGHEGSATSLVTVAISNVDDEEIVADAGWDLTLAAGATAWLDGTASSADQGQLTYSWSLVSWPGDNQPSLAARTTETPSFVAATQGTYAVRLTVSQGSLTDTDDVSVVARVPAEGDTLVQADLLVDTNRDGTVNASDETGEDDWDTASGALFFPNTDDDDGDQVRDGWDNRANGDADLLDMAPALVRQIPGLHRKHTAVMEMTYVSTSVRPQLFYERPDGGIELLIGGKSTTAELPLDQLVAGDLQLYLESRLGRDAGFDGQLLLALSLEDDGTEVSRDSVALRGSPILFSTHVEPAERVFVAAPYATADLVNALKSHLPATTDLYELGFFDYRDRWIQDSMQTGYVQRPFGDGARSVSVFTQLHRGHGLQRFLPEEYLGAEKGYVYPGGRAHSTSNFGGNIEVVPPYSHGDDAFPFGRIVVGGSLGTVSSSSQRQVDFFNAQGLQGPVLVVDTQWLAVSHVDEIFAVLPNRNAGAGERAWVIAIGSPTLAIELLEEAVADGYGDVPVFEGREEDETTPRELLDDGSLMGLNRSAQSKIDTVREQLTTAIGLGDGDFREVPALFEGKASRMFALVPSMQNLLVTNDVLFVADPEGPTVQGEDILQRAMVDAVDDLGLTVHFVDIYQSYHVRNGAVHCGTNVERGSALPAWWLQADTRDP